jgi:cell division protein FtsQ
MINRKKAKMHAQVFRVIYDDDFLTDLFKLFNGRLKMLNRNYNYEIDFGNVTDMEQKFKDYKAFFQKQF